MVVVVTIVETPVMMGVLVIVVKVVVLTAVVA